MTKRYPHEDRRAEAVTRYVDRRGRPIPKSVWQQLSQSHAYPHVAMDAVAVGRTGGIAHVYTFWLGIIDGSVDGIVDGTVGGHRRLVFRTVLPRPGLPSLAWGWATETDARVGHRAVCAWLTGHAPMPRGLLARPADRPADVREPVTGEGGDPDDY